MKEPSVSLIIPMYNAEKYVEQCIYCVKHQTYKNIDVIFIDDGSTDSTAELCQKGIMNLPNARLIRTKNCGVSAARNTGIDHANGQYIAFADVDDFFYADYIEYLVTLALKYSSDIAICSYEMEKNLNAQKKRASIQESIKKFSPLEALENVSYRKELSAVSYVKLIKRDISDRVRFNERLTYWEDYLYVTEIIKNSSTIVYSNQIKYIYLQNSGSATHRSDYSKRMASWKILSDCLKQYCENYPEIQNSFKAKALSASMDMLKWNYRNGCDETTLRKNVKENTFSVAKDRKCPRLKRVLAFCAGINIDMTIWMGKATLKMLSTIGFEL